VKRLAVYCGSHSGTDPAFAEAAKALGTTMAARGIELVYGGGRLGLMGVIADAVLAAGGQAHGVIPEALIEYEVAHTGLTSLHVVGSLHQRKAKMTELTDAFVALPGGIGTLDELFEAWSWNALGYHAKPFALLNVAGFWDELIAFLDTATTCGFMTGQRRAQIIVHREIDLLLDALAAAAREARRKMTW